MESEGGQIILMYTQEDLSKLNKQVRNILFITIVIFIGFLIAAVMIAIYDKSQWLAQLVLIIGVCLDIFIWGIKATPTLCYRGFINEILNGLSREEIGRVVNISSEPVYKDNKLFYYEVLIEQSNDEDVQRVLLLDIYKNTNDIKPGETYVFKVHSNFIVDYKLVA